LLQDPLSQLILGLFLFAILIVVAIVQTAVVRSILHHGGKVSTIDFRFPDALVALVLATFFVAIGLKVILRRTTENPPVQIEQVLPSAVVFCILSLGVLAFLKYRQLQLRSLFGLVRLSLLQVIGWSFGLVIVAFILGALANTLSLFALQGKSQPQPLVELFRSLAINHDYPSLAKIFLAAVILAPISEEILFRGLFYGVGKRYLNPVLSALACSLLFAAFHLSLSAFAGLFILALCLTLAYERTGSLLVPIGMHSLFNFISLCIVYFQALHNLPSS
jgi:membrane protease YdiL (CAAX protease family)